MPLMNEFGVSVHDVIEALQHRIRYYTGSKRLQQQRRRIRRADLQHEPISKSDYEGRGRISTHLVVQMNYPGAAWWTPTRTTQSRRRLAVSNSRQHFG